MYKDKECPEKVGWRTGFSGRWWCIIHFPDQYQAFADKESYREYPNLRWYSEIDLTIPTKISVVISTIEYYGH